jgi:hypothetical protein
VEVVIVSAQLLSLFAEWKDARRGLDVAREVGSDRARQHHNYRMASVWKIVEARELGDEFDDLINGWYAEAAMTAAMRRQQGFAA